MVPEAARSQKRASVFVAATAALAFSLAACATKDLASTTDTASKPTNDLPNPYKSERPWGQLPEGRKWGALSAVAIDNDGHTVWIADRCGPNPKTPAGVSPYLYDSCSDSSAAPIHHFDLDGHLIRSFGAGMFVFPHKVYMDRRGDIWVLDNRGPNARERVENPESAARGHAAYKFSPEGKLLLTIGTPGKAGNPPQSLTEPNSIVELPNGDLLIAEGHSGQYPTAPPETVARISRFDATGKYISSFGKLGSGPGEFRTPHDLALDLEGRLLVADRGNMRIQVLDPSGSFISEMKQYGRPSGIALRGDTLYVADSESNGVAPHPGWERGIRVGSYSKGTVLYRIPDVDNLKGTSGAEGLAVDIDGTIYGAEVGTQLVARHSLSSGKPRILP